MAEEDFFINENGCKIFCKHWCKDLKSPRSLVFMVHGAAEHCLYYTQLAEMLKERNFYVFSHDHEGHGQSGGTRMQISDMRHYTRDIFQHIEKVKQQFPNIPVFLIGHSMGGCLSVISAIDKPDYFAGMVLIAPAVTPEQDTIGPVRIFFGKLFARIIPSFPVLSLDDEGISRDPAVVQKYKSDPLCYHGSLKAKWCLSLLHIMQEIEANLSKVNIPFFILHGTEDKLINSEGSEALYKEASSQDKKLKIIPDAYHQLHFEIEPLGSEVRKEIVDWIDQHAPSS